MDKIIKAWDGAAGPTGAGRHAGASAAVAAVVTAICINMVLDAAFCGSRATVCMSGGLEMRKVSLSGGRAGRVVIFFCPLDFGAGSPGPHKTRHCGDHGDRPRSSNHMAT